MNILFGGVFLAVVGGVFAFMWAAAVVAMFVGKRRQWPLLKWGGAGCFAMLNLALLGFAALLVAAVVGQIVDSPESIYERTFHEQPTPDVSHIKVGSNPTFLDAYSEYLRFNASRSTFERLVPEGASRVTVDEYVAEFPVSPAEFPSVWDGIDPETTEIYVLHSDHGKRFSREITVIMYEARTRVVQHGFHGLD